MIRNEIKISDIERRRIINKSREELSKFDKTVDGITITQKFYRLKDFFIKTMCSYQATLNLRDSQIKNCHERIKELEEIIQKKTSLRG